jgi:hypothetical protein
MNRLLVFGIVVVAAGCSGDEKPSELRQMEAKSTVGLLFEHEGVRVYRFGDGVRYHYYAVAGNQAYTFSSWSESCGKNCTKHVVEEIPTVRR